jgi:hypothetical protein
MKTSIGEIVDRYTICKLKSERLELDLSQEINELLLEISNYNELETYIERLYGVNGDIWNLESDIRKGNEAILGLEEIGRRALKIRDFNNIRVGIKNEINSKFREGFVEYKMNHGSEKEKSLVISFTTVPERLQSEKEDGLKLVISSLCEQEDNDYEVHFNIPDIYHVTKQPYVIPNWINEYKLKYPNLKIFRVEDLGPPTKFVPTLKRIKNEDTIILVVDDDLVYHSEMVSEHKKYQSKLINSAIGYDGRGSEKPLYDNDIRDSWVLCVTEIRETHGLQHYKSVSYKKKLFKNDFFTDYLGKTFSDDVLISKYFRNNKIPMYIVPYEKENHLYETRELWDINQGVTSFPVLRYASSVPDTGCNHPTMLEKQPKFYEPSEFNKSITPALINSDMIKFNTDKYNHGYMVVYEPLFLKMKDSKKILEIGIYQGDSLKMLSEYFKKSKIYGIDIADTSHLNSEKIITYVYNQEKEEDLLNFIELNGGNFDIIIDDGGHTMKQQQTSFGVLFKSLNSGGAYIIEDLHTSNIDRFKSGEDLISTLDMLNKLNDTGELISNYINDGDKEYIKSNISSIDIWTRTPNFDESVTSIIIKK